MNPTATTPQRGPIPAGSPRFRGLWNGRHRLASPTDAPTAPVGALVRRSTAAHVLPGRAAIGVLGAPRRARRPGAAA